jgi:hypothetical protein
LLVSGSDGRGWLAHTLNVRCVLCVLHNGELASHLCFGKLEISLYL